jgi:hypothetical protein
MAESIAKVFYPSLYSKLEKKKNSARQHPLTMPDINTLLSMQFNNKPLFPSIEAFFSDEYLQALKDGVPSIELDKIQRFRKPTETELNLLFNDIHAREEKEQYSGGGSPQDGS